jgi:hypothetical protein
MKLLNGKIKYDYRFDAVGIINRLAKHHHLTINNMETFGLFQKLTVFELQGEEANLLLFQQNLRDFNDIY